MRPLNSKVLNENTRQIPEKFQKNSKKIPKKFKKITEQEGIGKARRYLTIYFGHFAK